MIARRATLTPRAGIALVLLSLCGCGRQAADADASAAAEPEQPALGVALDEDEREKLGVELWLKWEGANPTGSFKDRGMTIAVSKALEDGARAVVCASTGNTAASAAAYAARAGITAVILQPAGAVARGKIVQAQVVGARVLQVQGPFEAALTAAQELARRGITANAVAPGVIRTTMLDGLKPEVLASYEQQIPVGRIGMPEDVAHAILFLACEESSYITGQVLHPNGGTVVNATGTAAAEVLVESSADAQLLVIGRHDPLVPIGSHIGPVARAVLREATCPVLLATPRPHRAAYHP